MWTLTTAETVLLIVFAVTQILYLASFAVDGYLFSRPINWVPPPRRQDRREADDLPFIILFYPVLNELEATMRTTFTSLAHLRYPLHRYRVIAIPNEDDRATIASLRRLGDEFPFLEIMEVPPTNDPRWDVVWEAWDENSKAYWWHRGVRAGNSDLPPKKTRQLIYSFYQVHAEISPREDFLVNYIDADSAPPRDHFLAGAAGMREYDVIQATNVAGNLNASMAASWHSFDHMSWDGRKYAHLSADGSHPFWVLGKGLFFRASDLFALGSFHPWLTIEDPEVGLRFWKNGKRLGVIADPLIEEVPETVAEGIKQRQRWVCGFFQTLGAPLDEMGFTPVEKLKAWTNFLPCLALWLNAVGVPVGLWVLFNYISGAALPLWLGIVAMTNLGLYALAMASLYWSTWKRTGLVLDRRRDRLWYMLRINPFSIMLWWLIWIVPLWKGWRMYRRDEGLVWERTEKINANEDLVRTVYAGATAARPAFAPAAPRQEALAALPRERELSTVE